MPRLRISTGSSICRCWSGIWRNLRTFYHEAVAAQPGPGAPNHAALNDWIFGGTALGETFQAIAVHLTEEGSPMSMLVRGLLIPEGYYRGGSAFPDAPEFGRR